MKYNNIFWLEDHPDDLIGIDQTENVSLTEVLHSTTMAHDYVTGREIVSEEDFDLYVLDGDFPYQIAEQHMEKVAECMELMKNGKFKDVEKIKEITQGANNMFAEFYLNNKDDINGDVVVFSRSQLVPHLASRMGLPCYSKQSFSEDVIRRRVMTAEGRSMFEIRIALPESISARIPSDIDRWECGNVRDFVARYLK